MARRPGAEAEIRSRIAISPGLNDAEAHTLAGLLDAESHLAIAPNNNRTGWRCACAVSLRDDDQQVLVDYKEKLGLGHLVSFPARNGSRPQLCWTIGSKLECQVLAELLDAHPLRGRKLREYEIWREAVTILASKGGRKARQYLAWRPGAQAIAEAVIERSPLDDSVVEEARRELAQATAYRPPATPLRQDDGSTAARAAYLQVLRQWADSVDGPLSCGTYSAVRRNTHPDWPKRETIAETFGSWHDALRAAGLEARAVRPRPIRPRRIRLDRLHGRGSGAYRAAVLRRLRGLLRPA